MWATYICYFECIHFTSWLTSFKSPGICRHFKYSSSSLPILQKPICSFPLGTWVPKIGETNGKPIAMLRPNASLSAALSLLVQGIVFFTWHYFYIDFSYWQCLHYLFAPDAFVLGVSFDLSFLKTASHPIDWYRSLLFTAVMITFWTFSFLDSYPYELMLKLCLVNYHSALTKLTIVKFLKLFLLK